MITSLLVAQKQIKQIQKGTIKAEIFLSPIHFFTHFSLLWKLSPINETVTNIALVTYDPVTISIL